MAKTIEERIAIIETEVTNIKEFIVDIKDNHLPTIYKKLDRLPLWATVLISVLTSVCTGLIIVGVK